MRRWVLKAGVTDVDGMILEEVAMPVPGPGEVRVRIHAVSLNYREQFVLTEAIPSTWRTPGRDLVPVSDGAGGSTRSATGSRRGRSATGSRRSTSGTGSRGGPAPTSALVSARAIRTAC